MKRQGRAARGTAIRQLEALSELRHVLRSGAAPEKILGEVASIAASRIGHYCLVDTVDRRGVTTRLTIAHADAGRRVKLDVALQAARAAPTVNPRVTRLIAGGKSEILPTVRVSSTRARLLADVKLLEGEEVCSYLASIVFVNGVAVAVITLVRTDVKRPFDAGDRSLLEAIADWTGLGIENAQRREDGPQRKVAQPAPPRRRSGVNRISGVHHRLRDSGT